MKLTGHPPIVIPIALYAIVAPVVLGLGIYMDQRADVLSNYLHHGGRLHQDSITVLIYYWIILLFIYCARGLVLVSPLYAQKQKWQSATVGGVIALLPELYVVITAIGMIIRPASACQTGGPFSQCGWGPLIWVGVVISFFAQILGMSVGALIAASRK